MHDEQILQVRTGGDPRSLPQLTALRDEMNKLTHPARPDVDWKQVEKLSLVNILRQFKMSLILPAEIIKEI